MYTVNSKRLSFFFFNRNKIIGARRYSCSESLASTNTGQKMMKGQKDLLRSYGKGAAMLLKMGYKPGTGLGNDGSGIVEPILPILRKRGEGIKVDESGKKSGGMMQSKVVDDWEYDDDDSDMEAKGDDESDDDEGHKSKPLGFEKSGIYKSEYEIPEIFDLVRDVRAMGITVSTEVLEWIDSQRDNDHKDPKTLQKLKEVIWSVLKSSKGDMPKIKYLEFEIENIQRFIDGLNEDTRILEEVLEVIISEADVDISLLAKIEGIEACSVDIKNDILELLARKISPSWKETVERCEIVDIISFGELLDKAGEYLSLYEILNVQHMHDYMIQKKKIHNDVQIIDFPNFTSTILRPIIEKVNTFMSTEWDVQNVNVGIGIIEEVKDSGLFPEDIFDVVFIEFVVVGKLLEGIDKEQLEEENVEGNKMLWIIQWLKSIPMKYFDPIILSVLAKYCKWLQNYPGELDDPRVLDTIGVNYWKEVSTINREVSSEFSDKIERSLLKYCVRKLRGSINFNTVLTDPWSLVSEATISSLKVFTNRIVNFELFKYSEVIHNEIMLPYWTGYMQFYDSVHSIGDYEMRVEEGNSFLRAFVEVFSYAGLFDDEVKFKHSVINGVRICFDHNSHVNGRALLAGSRKVLADFPDVPLLEKRRVKDWEIMIDKSDCSVDDIDDQEQYSHTKEETGKKFGNIKDIVFARCEELGISIIPIGRKEEDKQMYEVTTSQGTKYEVYFGNKVMFANLGNQRDVPVGIEELINGHV